MVVMIDHSIVQVLYDTSKGMESSLEKSYRYVSAFIDTYLKPITNKMSRDATTT